MSAGREPVTVADLARMKAAGLRIVMVTAYDYPSAVAAEAAGVDVVLVGDSAAMTVLGYDSTLPIGMTEMLILAAAVRRGLRTPLLVGDLPYGSYEDSDAVAVANARRFVTEAGCDAVKLEGGGPSVERARALVHAGIPVMGHVGLTPQSVEQLGGYRAQGRTADSALGILADALALQQAGCFSLVFEAIPAAVTELIVPLLEVPVIGIGAGPAADGQVLVLHDLVGLQGGHTPKFVKRYAEVLQEMIRAMSTYAAEVRTRAYPGVEHSYGMAAEELAEFRKRLGRP